MLLASCVSHGHFPNFSAGILVAIEPKVPVAAKCARGAIHQQEVRAFLPHSKALCAFYTNRRLKSNMTLICKVTLNFICTSLVPARRGCQLPLWHRAAGALGKHGHPWPPCPGASGWTPATVPLPLRCCHQHTAFLQRPAIGHVQPAPEGKPSENYEWRRNKLSTFLLIQWPCPLANALKCTEICL